MKNYLILLLTSLSDLGPVWIDDLQTPETCFRWYLDNCQKYFYPLLLKALLNEIKNISFLKMVFAFFLLLIKIEIIPNRVLIYV